MFSISMGDEYLLEATAVSAYLSIHVTINNSNVMPWDIIDQSLELLVVVILLCIFLDIGRYTAMYNHDLCMRSD